ncbi:MULTISPECIES: GbsR/MarR family transcriptional regulator [Heyndrickxia]|uniref:GbsR/MarR family transcriptional regulator n=1 Tax=Heyndrickxia TaxID=2837504 RepID=UPI000F8717EC|nr:GbsR/MarR family transcriptional regulator [Heyndrickxia shackletonii]MBB2478834.1 GbsR/MarR family transcriptional regulator [Bacillus sp. APMAM]NEY97710.1 GbsR/MarR family transcriptional regulator [Heyndrickxia shackletonii]RTZ57585.1 GbsR/MarR family transcriptional regulator [Bacillus sp. SAJ1]
MNAKDQLEKIRERVIESIAQNMNLYGIAPSIGRLYGMMFFHHEPLTLDEMKDELGMSKTSMSTSVRALLELKMVDKVWKKGVRRDLYAVEGDWYQNFIDLFSVKWRTAISMNTNTILKSIKELQDMLLHEEMDKEIKDIIKSDIDKLEYTLEYYDWLNRLVDIFESHEIFNYVPKKVKE